MIGYAYFMFLSCIALKAVYKDIKDNKPELGYLLFLIGVVILNLYSLYELYLKVFTK